jgi:SAM-dependent methyltransferase
MKKLKNIYSDDGGEAYQKKKHVFFYNDYYYRTRAEYIYETIWKKLKLRGDEKILDFGCGMGQNIFLVKNQSIGYDVSKFAVDFCLKKGINATTDYSKLKDDSFDIIISTEVFEHLENPYETLVELRKKLKRGGKFVITVPRGLDYKDGKLDSYLDESQELYGWSIPTLKNLLIRTGYNPLFSKNIKIVGFHKFLFARKISFKFYLFLLNIAGRMVKGGKNILIIAKNGK